MRFHYYYLKSILTVEEVIYFWKDQDKQRKL